MKTLFLFVSDYIKYVSLVILTVQNAVLGLSMRYARTRDVAMFSSAAGKHKVLVLSYKSTYINMTT